MKAIVADAAGSGWLRDKDGNDVELEAELWTECDVRVRSLDQLTENAFEGLIP